VHATVSTTISTITATLHQQHAVFAAMYEESNSNNSHQTYFMSWVTASKSVPESWALSVSLPLINLFHFDCIFLRWQTDRETLFPREPWLADCALDSYSPHISNKHQWG